MSEERAIYQIAPKKLAQPIPKPAQEVIKDIASRASDNLLWLLNQLEEEQARETIEAIIKARPALAREILDNMDDVQGS